MKNYFVKQCVSFQMLYAVIRLNKILLRGFLCTFLTIFRCTISGLKYVHSVLKHRDYLFSGIFHQPEQRFCTY